MPKISTARGSRSSRAGNCTGLSGVLTAATEGGREMRVSRSIVAAAVLAAALSLVGAAPAVGPWPGVAASVPSSSGDVRYTATRDKGVTTVRAIREGTVVASTRIAGGYGIPAVTSLGEPGGLSPDGRLLVLVQPPTFAKGLRAQSRFVVLSTARLARVATIVLPGEFGFDALAPDRRTLYVIQHVSTRDLVRYVVRAYDLQAQRLLPRVIVDKRNPSEV